MILTSGMAPVLVDDTTVGAMIATSVRRHAERVALVDGPSGTATTYRRLGEEIERIAAWLYADGVRGGDRIGVWAPNIPAVVACSIAAMRLGAAVTGLNPGATETEVRTQLAGAS